jgi:hypothetical protein
MAAAAHVGMQFRLIFNMFQYCTVCLFKSFAEFYQSVFTFDFQFSLNLHAIFQFLYVVEKFYIRNVFESAGVG